MSNLLANRIITPDGTIIQSFNRHDYREYKDTVSGEWYMVDGGLDYLRGSVNTVRPTYDHCYDTDSHEKIRDYFHWGTRGVTGRDDLTYVPLKDLTDPHIQAILNTQWQIPPYIRQVFINELNWRLNV